MESSCHIPLLYIGFQLKIFGIIELFGYCYLRISERGAAQGAGYKVQDHAPLSICRVEDPALAGSRNVNHKTFLSVVRVFIPKSLS